MPIETVFDDNQSMPQPAANVASKLINQDKVDVLIGAVGSSQSIAMAKVADEAHVPMVTPASTNPSVTLDEAGQVRQYVFRTCFTDDFQGEGIVDFAVNGPIKAKNAVVFYDAENDYSVGIYETVKRVAPVKGLAIVAEDAYLGQSETDFRAKLTKFKGYDFDVLIVPGYYNQVGMIANQAREVGLDQPLLGGDGFDSPELYRVAGDNIVGSYFTNHYAADDMDPAVQGYIRKYKEYQGGEIPDAMSILTYDAVKVVASVIEKVGNTDHDAIAQALADVQDFKGAAGTITINAQHNATKKLVVLEIGAGGQFQWVYTYDPLAGQPSVAEETSGEEDSAPPEEGDAASEGDQITGGDDEAAENNDDEMSEAEDAVGEMNETAKELENT
jgi:branched-chain amino acid transport system substrate-binding protein